MSKLVQFQYLKHIATYVQNVTSVQMSTVNVRAWYFDSFSFSGATDMDEISIVHKSIQQNAAMYEMTY
jgi:hypothetical protein